MDIDEIKNLISADNGKFIVIENGKPIFVMMSFEDYKNILEKNNNDNIEDDMDNQDNQQDDNIAEPEDLEQEKQEARDQGLEFPGQLEY
ncbi:MAG: hypothetical protein U9Q27_00690 [Patescibacteria group bacterium]|nr:hypothetical protein [Patescibacteria group bacterium]